MSKSSMVSEELSEDQVEALREVFFLFDKDGDETITVNELGTVMRALGQVPTEEEMRAIIAEIDADGNGIIEFPEIVDLMVRRPWGQQGSEAELRDAFSILDHQGDGRLSLAEMRRVLSTDGETLTEEELDKMLAHVETDGNGTVAYEDFVKMMMKE